jgi:acetyl esterase/lipase
MKSIRLLILAVFLAMSGCSGMDILNSSSRSSSNDVTTDVVFDAANKLKLDVYTSHSTRNAPTIVFFYGGRWTNGSKEEYEFVGQTLASRGFVVVIPDYRKYPYVRFPAFVEDSARAVRWARDNASRYGGSPDRVFVMGHSSGAHIAAMLALDAEFLKAVGMSQENLRGMIGLAGAYDFMPITAPDLRDMFSPPEKFALSQPIYYVDGRNPPLFLVHGENDEDAKVKNTRNLAEAVKKANGPVETLIYNKLSHGCTIAILSSASAIACGDPTPNLLTEISQFIRAHAQ